MNKKPLPSDPNEIIGAFMEKDGPSLSALAVRLLIGDTLGRAERVFLFFQLCDRVTSRRKGDDLTEDDKEFLALMVRLSEAVHPGKREAAVRAICKGYNVSRGTLFEILRNYGDELEDGSPPLVDRLKQSGSDIQFLKL